MFWQLFYTKGFTGFHFYVKISIQNQVNTGGNYEI